MFKVRKTVSKIQLFIEGSFFLVAGVTFILFTFETHNPIKYFLVGLINLVLSIFIFWIAKSYWLNSKKENSPNFFQKRKDLFSWVVYLLISLLSVFAAVNLSSRDAGILFVIFFAAFALINLISGLLRLHLWRITVYKNNREMDYSV